MKKIFCFLLILVILFSFTGCKNEEKTEFKNPENPICRVNLFASNGSYDKRFLIMNFGHSFISIENLSENNINVGDYILKKDEEITLSVWPVSNHSGVWYNIESGMIAATDKYSDRISVSFLIDYNTLEEINFLLKEAPTWNVFYNCSDFTLDIYNIITKSSYEPVFVTPNKLVKLFKEYDFDTYRTIAENDNIGYFKNGEFIRCELNY